MLQRTKSEDFFHQKPENLNCAQSVLKGFQTELNIPESKISDFKAYGGGRASGGICGALYAADILLAEQGKKSVKQEFEETVGGIFCLQIKKEAKTSCKQCVKIADELLEKYLNE